MKLGHPIVALAALACLGLPLAASADNHETPPALVDVWYMVPKAGMENEFYEAAEAHMKFRKEKGDPREWTAYRPVIGHNLKPVQFRHCCSTWADLDTYRDASNEKGLGEHFNETVAPYVDHSHHYIERFDWENSHWPDDAGPHRYFGVTSWTWKEGAGPEVDEAREKFSQMAKNEGWGAAGNEWLWGSVIGGKPTLFIVTGYDNYADMAPPEQSFYAFLVEKMGDAEEVRKTFATFSSGFSSSDYTVWTKVPELSMGDDE